VHFGKISFIKINPIHKYNEMAILYKPTELDITIFNAYLLGCIFQAGLCWQPIMIEYYRHLTPNGVFIIERNPVGITMSITNGFQINTNTLGVQQGVLNNTQTQFIFSNIANETK